MVQYRQILISLLLILCISCTTKSQTETKFDNVIDTKMNHLVNEQSPYLLQHADNPVDWYPWGEEAFKKALNNGFLFFDWLTGSNPKDPLY